MPSHSGLTASPALQERYEFLDELGSGGFAHVYKALQTNTGQEVALKVMRLAPDSRLLSQRAQAERFRREMMLCARLHHPHIVRLIDSGSTEDGLLYTVFAFVPGLTLAEHLARSGPLPPRQAIRLMSQVLDALACAHDRGVVHRDLKPQNLMVTTTGGRMNMMVLDFGIGALTDAGDPQLGEYLGTPAYSAPEQLRREPVTTRSDLYSWGLVFLEALTGRRVFSAPDIPSLVQKQLSSAPIPIPAALLDHPLGGLLRLACAKDVNDRSPSAITLLRALDALDADPLGDALGGVAADEDEDTLFTLEPISSDTFAMTEDTLTLGTVSLPRIEARQLTALCVNVKVLAAGGTLDLEAWDGLLRAQQETVAEVAERAGGYLAASLGERVLIYFGYPRAQEDDARRAAGVAAELAELFAQRSAALEEARGVRLEVRMGLHTGLTVARPEGAAGLARLQPVVGEAPSRAVALESAAAPGEVWVSEATRALVRRHFDLVPADAAPTDGHEERAFLLRGAARQSTTHLSTFREDFATLVGRDHELGMLRQRRALAEGGEGQAVLLSGEAGIGKSRLLHELRQDLGGARWLEGRCSPQRRQIILAPFIEVLEGLLGRAPDWSGEQTGAQLARFLGDQGVALEGNLPLLGRILSVPTDPAFPLPEVEPHLLRARTLAAMTELFLGLAAERLVVLSIEDLHWADSGTLDLLGALVDGAQEASLLLAFTARPEFTPPWQDAGVLQLQLRRLPRGEIAALVGALTGGAPVQPEVLERVADRTDGVPLFVEEVVRTLLEDGALVERGGAWVAAGPLDELPIPLTLRESLTARLDRLGDARQTAQLASAIGREFELPLLRALSARGDELEADLEALRTAGLASRRRRGEAWMFRHALIQDTAYESLLPSQRQLVHGQIASTLEAKFPEVAEASPGLLKYHYTRAERPREAVGYALKACQRGIMLSENQSAVGHTRDGLALVERLPAGPERDGLEMQLRGSLGHALSGLFGYGSHDVGDALQRAAELVDAVGGGPELFPLRIGWFSYLLVRGRFTEALAAGERNLALARGAGQEGLVLAAELFHGSVFYPLGDYEAARALFQSAADRWSPGAWPEHVMQFGHTPGITAQQMLSMVLHFMGDSEAAEAASVRSLEQALATGHSHTEGLAMGMRCQLLHAMGRHRELRELADRTVAICGERGVVYWQLVAVMLGAWSRAWEDPSQLDVLEGTIGHYGMMGARQLLPLFWGLLADASLGAGQLERARAALDKARDEVAQTGEMTYEPRRLLLEGRLAARQGDAAAAEGHLEAAIALAARQPHRALQVEAALELSALVRAEQPGRARGALEAVEPWLGEGHHHPVVGAARRALAELR